jgi:hypothetical protein
VLVHNCSEQFERALQNFTPSVLGSQLGLHVPEQSLPTVQTCPQVPLLRHVWPLGQEQATDWPQVPGRRTVSQRRGQIAKKAQFTKQVSSRGSGVQQVPLAQNWTAAQLPHEPPQPSSPHTLRRQRGVQGVAGGDGICVFFFFLRCLWRLCLPSAASSRKTLKLNPEPASPRKTSRRDGVWVKERVNLAV